MKRISMGCGLTVGFLFIAFFLAMGGIEWPFELAFDIVCGWCRFLAREYGKVRWSPIGITTGIGALLAFTVGLHYFLSWLYSNLATRPVEFRPARPAWRLRWTVQAVSIMIFAFIAGISMVGVTHQCAWLASSKEPIISNYGGVRWRGGAAQSRGHLLDIGEMVTAYEKQHLTLPIGGTTDSDGRGLHSWQTMILPYFSETLFKQIDLSKPWDSPENSDKFKELVYPFCNRSADAEVKDSNGFGLTTYAGNAYVLGGTEPRKMTDFQGGESRTIVVGEAAGNFKPWGKPGNWRDPKLGINKSPDGFGGNRNGPTMFLKADGGVIGLTDDIDPAVFQSLCTPGGKEPLPEQ